jgi:hypothetical protein
MSVGDVNSVDPTGGFYPSRGDLQGSNPALAAQFQAYLQSARQNMTAGQHYAFNNMQPNQTTTGASPRFNFQQPGPQTNKVPLPTNTPGHPTIKPGAGWFATELGLVGAAFHQLGHMQHMIENAPVFTLDGERFDPDAVKKEIMKQLPDADRERLGLPAGLKRAMPHRAALIAPASFCPPWRGWTWLSQRPRHPEHDEASKGSGSASQIGRHFSRAGRVPDPDAGRLRDHRRELPLFSPNFLAISCRDGFIKPPSPKLASMPHVRTRLAWRAVGIRSRRGVGI